MFKDTYNVHIVMWSNWSRDLTVLVFNSFPLDPVECTCTYSTMYNTIVLVYTDNCPVFLYKLNVILLTIRQEFLSNEFNVLTPTCSPSFLYWLLVQQNKFFHWAQPISGSTERLCPESALRNTHFYPKKSLWIHSSITSTIFMLIEIEYVILKIVQLE